MIDAHCHIQFQAYDADRDEVIKRCIADDVQMIAVGTKYSTSVNAIALAEKYPKFIWATVGFHPTHVNKSVFHDKSEEKSEAPEIFDYQKMLELAKNKKVVAIGECGLDYFRLDIERRTSIIAHQREAFEAQINLAAELKKPLMLHCRASKGTDDAYEDLYVTLKTSTYNLKPVLHFYAGSLAMTKKFVDAGYYFTFGGVITFSNDYDEIIKYIPMDRIMLETDAPYVAPIPYRGSRNEPRYLVEVAKRLVELKQLPQDEIIKQTSQTTQCILNL